jgi:hypothetical protein
VNKTLRWIGIPKSRQLFAVANDFGSAITFPQSQKLLVNHSFVVVGGWCKVLSHTQQITDRWSFSVRFIEVDSFKRSGET